MAPIEQIGRQLRARRVPWHDHDGVVVIRAPESQTFALNPTAAILWRSLVTGADRARLVTALIAEFGIDELAAARDVDGFLERLASRGLLAEAV